MTRLFWVNKQTTYLQGFAEENIWKKKNKFRFLNLNIFYSVQYANQWMIRPVRSWLLTGNRWLKICFRLHISVKSICGVGETAVHIRRSQWVSAAATRVSPRPTFHRPQRGRTENNRNSSMAAMWSAKWQSAAASTVRAVYSFRIVKDPIW